MNMNYGTLATNGTTFTIGTSGDGERPKKPPQGLIATQAVQTQAGWLGQVFVDKKIVFESAKPHARSDSAIEEANKRVVDTVARLFTDTAPETSA